MMSDLDRLGLYMFEIKVEKEHDLFDVRLGDSLSLADVADYVAELQRLFTENDMSNYAMIIDVRACPLQDPYVVDAMQYHMETMPKARSLAVITGDSLVRIQIRRLFRQPYARVVDNYDQARKWVLHGVEPGI